MLEFDTDQYKVIYDKDDELGPVKVYLKSTDNFGNQYLQILSYQFVEWGEIFEYFISLA